MVLFLLDVLLAAATATGDLVAKCDTDALDAGIVVKA
jgi:hypothetical protein